MRILLLNPPNLNGGLFVREGRCMNRQSTWGNIWPPFSLMCLSSVLKADGHRMMLIDGMVGCGTREELVKKVRSFSPELTVVNTATPTIYNDLAVARLVKRETGSQIALTGAHVTGTHREVIEEEGIDFVIRREPEETARSLAHAIAQKGGYRNVRGITYKDSGRVVVNPDRPLIEDLDGLPFPDRDIVDNSRYMMPFTREPFTLINTSRGCPFLCIYCNAHLYYGRKHRARSPSSVVAEMEECVKKYGIRNFLFWADNATLDSGRMEAICTEIKSRGLDVRWFCNSRAEGLSYALLRKMKEAGCFLISFGLESGDQRILDTVKKEMRLERALETIKNAKNAGLQVVGHFIFGLPGETLDSAGKTIEFARKCGVDYAQFYIAIPYPGTEMYDILRKEERIVTFDYSKYELMNAVVRTRELTENDLASIRRKAFRSFYLRPTYIANRLTRVRSVRELGSLISQGFHFLREWGFGGLT